MRALVVGGAGYIGSHIARALLRRNDDVVIYDNLSTGHRRLARDCQLVVGEIRDRSLLAGAIAGMDVVFHFAAHAYVGESVTNPRKYFENNVAGGLELLNVALDCGVRHIVFSSSCAVYGVPERFPITEDAPCRPVSPYGESKLFFERALAAYDRAYQLRYIALRYFNAAGADESGEIGELHEPETHLIPSALLAATGARPPLEIFGADYATPDGTCVRDYVHVADLADAHVMAADRLCAQQESSVLNLGIGQGASVREIIRIVEKVTGKSVPCRVSQRRDGDPAVLIADARRARAVLGWKPTRTLPDMVDSAWKWLQSPAVLAAPK
jgi:UDP-glucose-4-epimerase GalE